MKLKFATISALMVGTVITATIALSQSMASKSIIATGVPVSHAVEITSFAYPAPYTESHYKTKQYPVAALDNPGNYCYFDDQAFMSPSFNTGDHLIEASNYAGGPVFLLMLSQTIAEEKNLFATEADSYDVSKRISLFGFDNLTQMDFQMGEGNQAVLGSNNDGIECAYDADTKTYSLTGNFSSFAYFGPSFPGATKGTRTVIDKITLYYDC